MGDIGPVRGRYEVLAEGDGQYDRGQTATAASAAEVPVPRIPDLDRTPVSAVDPTQEPGRRPSSPVSDSVLQPPRVG